LPAVANASNPTLLEGKQVLLSTDLSGNLRTISEPGSTTAVTGNVTVVQTTGTNLHVFVDNATATAGTLSNNTAAPIADNVGVLPAIANAANPTWVEGNQVLESVDLSGNQRVKVNAPLPAGTNVIGHVISDTGSTTAVTGNVTVVQPTGTNLHVVVDSTTGTAAENLVQVAGVSLGATAVTNFGTAPAATAVPGVNSSIFAGTTGITATGSSLNVDVTNTVPVTLASTTVTNTVAENLIQVAGVTLGATAVTNYGTAPAAAAVPGVNAFITNVPHVISDTGSTTAVTGSVTVVQPTGTNLHVVVDSGSSLTAAVTGTLTNNNAAPAALNNLGVLPAVANATHPTWTEGDQVLLSEDLLGNLRVSVQAGSIVAFQGTSPWVVDGNLTNNNAAPTATLQGVMGAIAETAYTTVTYTTGDLVLPVTDLHGALNQDLQAVAGVQLGATAVTAYGTAPAAVNVPGVNAFITNTPAVTLASTTITGTVAVTQSTSPWVVSLASTTVTNIVGENLIQVAGIALGASAVTNFGSTPATGVVPGVNSSIFAGTTGITATGSSLNVNLTNSLSIAGSLTNNNAAPTATLLGVLGAIAETAYTTVTYTTGDMVLPVTDLHGALNQDLQAVAGVQLGSTGIVAYGSTPAAVNVPAVNAFITNTPAVTLSTGVAPAGFTGTSLNVDVTNTVAVAGTLTNNNAAPAANNFGVLPAVANVADPTWTEGDQVLLSETLSGKLRVETEPHTQGGVLTVTGTIGATATAIKASAGQLYGWYIGNNNSTIVYCQIFNVASGSVTLGTTAPTLSFMIPANCAANVLNPMGIAFGTAISFAFTTTRSGLTGPAVTCDYNFFYF
jgi:hypothetical protein